MPVIYFNQKEAWVDHFTFKTLFYSNFVLQVCKHLRLKDLPENDVLLLDNETVHPNENVLKPDDGKWFGKYLPSIVTALIQPVDRGVMGVIATTKRHHSGSLLQKHTDVWSHNVLEEAFFIGGHIWGVICPEYGKTNYH